MPQCFQFNKVEAIKAKLATITLKNGIFFKLNN